MEQFGFYYYFRHDNNKHTLVLADDPNAHSHCPHAIPFMFDQTEYRTVDDHIWQWSVDMSLHTGKFTFRDYNFTTPSADLTAKDGQPRAIICTTSSRSTSIPARTTRSRSARN